MIVVKENKKNRFFKKPKIVEFPNIYLNITEHASKQLKKISPQLVIAWISVTLLVAIVFASFDFSSTLKQKQELYQEREKIMSEIRLWQDVAKKYKGYRDAYFTLAVLEYRLGEYGKAKDYLRETLNLDPNFEKGKELETLLDKK